MSINDTPSAAETPGIPASITARQRWTLLATILASSLAFIDGSVINVALPAIGRSLSAGAAELQWTINAYLLPLSALLLLGGAAGDFFGRRRLLLSGTALFALASIACALAPGIQTLLAARVLQGMGAATLMPNSLAILGQAFSGERRGRAIGTWAAVGAIAGAVGPPLGGWLVEIAGWRSIFLINIPLALGAMFIAYKFVDESGEGDTPLDTAGALLATFALGALTWSLTRWSSQHAADLGVAIGTGVGVLACWLFLAHEKRLGDRAMMPLALFGSRSFVGLSLLTFLLYGALGGLFVLLPFLLMEGGAYSPLQAGLALLPFPVVIGSASRLMGGVTEHTGPKWTLGVGAAIASVGFLLFAFVDPAAGYWTGVFPAMVVIALGMAGVVAPLTTAVLSSVDGRHTGTASGLNSAIARTGGLIATALAGAVIAHNGAALVSAFHGAAIVGACLALASCIAALTTLDGRNAANADKAPGSARG